MPRKTDYSDCFIYHIVDSDKVVHYIGSTSNFVNRKSQHKYNCNHSEVKHHNYDIYRYIRDNGGWDNFECVPIRRVENVKNSIDLRIAERQEMEKYSTLKNMLGSYMSKEDRKICNQKWKQNNPEKHMESVRKWQLNNPERKREIDRKYRENNREKIMERKRQYYLKQKELKNADQ